MRGMLCDWNFPSSWVNREWAERSRECVASWVYPPVCWPTRWTVMGSGNLILVPFPSVQRESRWDIVPPRCIVPCLSALELVQLLPLHRASFKFLKAQFCEVQHISGMWGTQYPFDYVQYLAELGLSCFVSQRVMCSISPWLKGHQNYIFSSVCVATFAKQ